MTKNKKTAYIAVGILGILLASSAAFALNSQQILRAVGVSKPIPVFSFDESKAPGWWAADNYNSRASTTEEKYEGTEPIEKFPVASMNVFKGQKGEYETACFVLFSFYDYKTDVAQLKKDKDSEVFNSTSMKKVGESTVSVDALGTVRTFTLANYELVGPDAENAMKGMSYGWVDTGDGYISVSGVCPSSDELKDTLEAVDAISLMLK